jgi:hypothetical protein
MIPAATDVDFSNVSSGWYCAPGWPASEHASEGNERALARPERFHRCASIGGTAGTARDANEGAARRIRLIAAAADPFYMGQHQGRLI